MYNRTKRLYQSCIKMNFGYQLKFINIVRIFANLDKDLLVYLMLFHCDDQIWKQKLFFFFQINYNLMSLMMHKVQYKTDLGSDHLIYCYSLFQISVYTEGWTIRDRAHFTWLNIDRDFSSIWRYWELVNNIMKDNGIDHLCKQKHLSDIY